MENTKEEMKKLDNNFIEAFALQYHGIECVKLNISNQLYEPWDMIYTQVDSGIYDNSAFKYIELRSIDDLTDEEFKKTLSLEGSEWLRDISELKGALNVLYASTIDYLRSIGVAVPFRGVSVEKMIESGKLKLRKK